MPDLRDMPGVTLIASGSASERSVADLVALLSRPRQPQGAHDLILLHVRSSSSAAFDGERLTALVENQQYISAQAERAAPKPTASMPSPSPIPSAPGSEDALSACPLAPSLVPSVGGLTTPTLAEEGPGVIAGPSDAADPATD